jgi:hypothetical protein
VAPRPRIVRPAGTHRAATHPSRRRSYLLLHQSAGVYRRSASHGRAPDEVVDPPVLAEALRLTQALEFAVEVVGVGVAEVIKDGQGVLPGVTGGVVVTSGELGIAQAGEGGGLVEPGTAMAVQLQGVLVAEDGLGVLAEVVMDVAETVPGDGLPDVVTQLLELGEGLPAVGESHAVFAEQRVAPAHVVERNGLPPSVIELSVQFQGLLVVLEGFPMAALSLK